MAGFVLICTVLSHVVFVVHSQVYVFENIEEHEQRISILESTITNASSCCIALKKENVNLKAQNQQLQTMMQNLSLQVLLIQQRVEAMATVPSTTVTPPPPAGTTQTVATQPPATTPTPGTPTPPTPPPTTTVSTRSPPKDCADWAARGETLSGTFDIDLRGTKKQVYCDLDHDGGKWTVIQRRRDASVDFNRNWTDYRDGFGNLDSEFWLGNEVIHQLTAAGNNVLNIKIMDWTGTIVFAQYSGFSLEGESRDYTLHVGTFTGTAGDSFNYLQSSLLSHYNQRFSTPDHDRDSSFMNCAKTLQSGWWFNDCYSSNLNGVFLKGVPYGPKTQGEVAGQPTMEGTGIEWYPWKHKQYSMAHVEMKIRP